MSDHQTLFFNRIRAALGKGEDQRAAWEEGIAPANDQVLFQAIANRSREEKRLLLRQLTDNAGPLHLQVHVCASLAEAGACVVAIAGESRPEFGGSKEVVLHDHALVRALHLEPLLAAQGIAAYPTRSNDPEVRRRTVHASIGVTAAAWAIAESATLVQLTRPGQPRSTSLAPSVHIALLALSDLVATLAEAYALIRRVPDLDTFVLISGPSKTADIEGVMVHGAHGPRAMHLIVLALERDADTA